MHSRVCTCMHTHTGTGDADESKLVGKHMGSPGSHTLVEVPGSPGNVFATCGLGSSLVGRFSAHEPDAVCLESLPCRYLACLVMHSSILTAVFCQTPRLAEKQSVPSCEKMTRKPFSQHPLPVFSRAVVLDGIQPQEVKTGTGGTGLPYALVVGWTVVELGDYGFAAVSHTEVQFFRNFLE